MGYLDTLVEILLVEDNPDDAELALHALSKEHFSNRVYHVTDGLEALDFLRREGKYKDRSADDSPKLVLLDMKLPKMGGIEVLKQIREDPNLARIPVVILTSSKESQDIGASYDYGANSYIVKPVDFDQFRRVVREVGLYWAVLNQPAQLRG